MDYGLSHSLFRGECNPLLTYGIEYSRALVAHHSTYLAIFVAGELLALGLYPPIANS